MTHAADAIAITNEFIAEAAKQAHKMATGFRGEVSGKFNGTEYKIVLASGRANCYVGGVKQSKVDFISQMEYDLSKESDRIDDILGQA